MMFQGTDLQAVGQWALETGHTDGVYRQQYCTLSTKIAERPDLKRRHHEVGQRY